MSLGRRRRFGHFEKAQLPQVACLFARVAFKSWPDIDKIEEETRKFPR